MDSDTWTTASQIKLEEQLTGSNKKDEKFKVPIYSDEESRKLEVYEIPVDVLSYNFDNVRIVAEKAKKENDLGRQLDPANPSDQKIVEDILYDSKFYSKTATKDLEQDIKLRGQDDPAIISVDGTVWNGNRRLAIRHKLLEQTGNPKYQRVKIVILPKMSGKELTLLERRLQMYRNWKEEYGPIQTRLDVRKSLNDPDWTDQEILASYGKRYPLGELRSYKNEIDLIDEYLTRLKKPYDYAIINEIDGGVESFVTLNNIIQKELSRKTDDMEIEKIKLAGFRLIRYPKSTYRTLRDFNSLLRNAQARNEFMRNSPTFNNYPKHKDPFEKDDLKTEFNNVDVSAETARSAKKDAKKLAKDALKILERITNGRMPKNNEEFKNTLEQIAEIVVRLRQCAG